LGTDRPLHTIKSEFQVSHVLPKSSANGRSMSLVWSGCLAGIWSGGIIGKSWIPLLYSLLINLGNQCIAPIPILRRWLRGMSVGLQFWMMEHRHLVPLTMDLNSWLKVSYLSGQSYRYLRKCLVQGSVPVVCAYIDRIMSAR
jgi:hypothetical protein